VYEVEDVPKQPTLAILIANMLLDDFIEKVSKIGDGYNVSAWEMALVSKIADDLAKAWKDAAVAVLLHEASGKAKK